MVKHFLSILDQDPVIGKLTPQDAQHRLSERADGT